MQLPGVTLPSAVQRGEKCLSGPKGGSMCESASWLAAVQTAAACRAFVATDK